MLYRLINEFENLKTLSDSAKHYYCMKVQGLLLSYLTTLLLVEPNRAKGRKLAKKMMLKIKKSLPLTYSLAKKQYVAFKLMNYFQFGKDFFELILSSKLYNKLRAKHDF